LAKCTPGVIAAARNSLNVRRTEAGDARERGSNFKRQRWELTCHPT
jgi:hypothetical protein